MTKETSELKPEFVDLMPAKILPGVLYVSIRFKSIQHLYCCGCGKKVVTPLSPTGWHLEYDGKTVTLRPSVGNWQKECKSHYLITNNKVRWARRWSDEEIASGLINDT